MAPSNMQAWFEEYKKIWEAPFRLEDYLNCHTEDVVYNDLTIPTIFNGRDGLREFYVRVLEAIPNFASRYERYYQQGDVVITEGALIGDQTEIYRGAEYFVDFLAKIKLEIILSDSQVEDVVNSIIKAAQTGRIGDGKIFITNLEETVRIRTGERGDEAI